MGFLKSVRSSSKAMIWGRSVCLSGLGQQLMAPHPSFRDSGIHAWALDQMELDAKVEKLRLREGRGLAQGHPTMGNGILVCYRPSQAIFTTLPSKTSQEMVSFSALCGPPGPQRPQAQPSPG